MSNSDAVDVGISLGIAVQNQESTVKLAEGAKIESTQGSVEFGAAGEATTVAEGEAIVFRDGIAGVAVGVAVEKATVLSEVNGTIIAANPQDDAVFEFTPTNVVNVAENSIYVINLRGASATTAQAAQPAANPNAPCRPSTPAPGANTGVPLEFAGTFAINFFEHTVEAKVGPVRRDLRRVWFRQARLSPVPSSTPTRPSMCDNRSFIWSSMHLLLHQ